MLVAIFNDIVFFFQFQKEYPDIYSRRFPNTESEAQLFADKPKIKPPMLIGMRKSKAFSIRNWLAHVCYSSVYLSAVFVMDMW